MSLKTRAVLLGLFAIVVIALDLLGARTAIPFAVVAALAIIATARTGGLVQSAAIVVATVGVILCVAECVATVIEPKIIVDRPGSNVTRPVIGWGPSAPGPYHVTRSVAGQIQYEATFTIDEHLKRKVESGAAGKGVAFMGDSFVFGTGIDDKDTLPQLFADDIGHTLPVFNFGIAGWSPANVLAELESGQVDDRLARTELAVEFVAPWHAERTGCSSVLASSGPRWVLADGKLEKSPTCKAHTSALSVFAFYRVFIAPHLRSVDSADIGRLVAITDATIRNVLDRHIPIIVYYLRDPAYLKGTSWTDDKVVATFEQAGAQVLDYNLPDDDARKYHIQGDGHPTPLANKLRAEKLVAFIRTHDPRMLATR